jgi:hypothetical protein
MPSEIAEAEGLRGTSSVKQLIIRVSDRLRAGEIRLIDFTPEHAAAQVKDRRAAQRRERYHQGLEASRAKQRECYHHKNQKLIRRRAGRRIRKFEKLIYAALRFK